MPPLPFRSVGELREHAGDLVAEVPVTVWPAPSGRTTGTGRAYDHEAQASFEFADALKVSNRRLVVDGVTFAIVDVSAYDVVPHVEVRLRRVEASGNG